MTLFAAVIVNPTPAASGERISALKPSEFLNSSIKRCRAAPIFCQHCRIDLRLIGRHFFAATENIFRGQCGQVAVLHAPQEQRLQIVFQFRAEPLKIFRVVSQSLKIFRGKIFSCVEVRGVNKIHNAPQIEPRIFYGRAAQTNREVML